MAFPRSHRAHKSKNQTQGSGFTTVSSPDDQRSCHAFWPVGGRVVEGRVHSGNCPEQHKSWTCIRPQGQTPTPCPSQLWTKLAKDIHACLSTLKSMLLCFCRSFISWTDSVWCVLKKNSFHPSNPKGHLALEISGWRQTSYQNQDSWEISITWGPIYNSFPCPIYLKTHLGNWKTKTHLWDKKYFRRSLKLKYNHDQQMPTFQPEFCQRSTGCMMSGKKWL